MWLKKKKWKKKRKKKKEKKEKEEKQTPWPQTEQLSFFEYSKVWV